jgi:hypothetical protein
MDGGKKGNKSENEEGTQKEKTQKKTERYIPWHGQCSLV